MYRYSLQKKAKQSICPSCGKRKFTPYIDVVTNVPLDIESCGRCSRENNCGYHYPPKELFKDRPDARPEDDDVYNIEEIIDKKEIDSIDPHEIEKYYNDIETNDLYKFLVSLFDKKDIDKAFDDYICGQDGENIIFWQFDEDGNIRTGKMVKYGTNGKRDKYVLKLMHSEIYGEDYVLKECYFGQHLVSKYKDKPIKIVESEKTAIICSIVYPEFVWISTGGKHKWMEDEWHILQDRDVIQVPDADAIEDWQAMLEDMKLLNINVSMDPITDQLEGTDDIADLIINKLITN